MYEEVVMEKQRAQKKPMTEKIEEEMRKAFSKHSNLKIAKTLHLKITKPNSKLLKSKCPRHNHHNTPRDASRRAGVPTSQSKQFWERVSGPSYSIRFAFAYTTSEGDEIS